MSENRLKDLLRPIVQRAYDAGRRTAEGRQSFSVQPAAPIAPDDEDDEWPPFGPEDARDFRRYYAPCDDGFFPGELHEHFGCSIRQFAEATGLKRVEVDGSEFWSPTGGGL